MIKILYYPQKFMKNMILLLLYIVFFAYMIRLILQEPTPAGKIAYLLVLLLLGGVAAWYELLKWFLYKATQHTILSGNEHRARSFLSLLAKLDFFRIFTAPARILELMLLWDHRDFQQMATQSKAVLQARPEDFETKLIFRYFCFVASGEQGDLKACSGYYHQLGDMRIACINSKSWKKRPYFSWHEVEGAYELYRGRWEAGLKAAEKVPIRQMNNREKMHHYYLLGRLYYGRGQFQEACRQLDLAIDRAGENSDMVRFLKDQKEQWLSAEGQPPGGNPS